MAERISVYTNQDGSRNFQLHQGESMLGDGVYSYDTEAGAYYLELVDIADDIQRQGNGTAILRAMLEEIGPGQPVYAVVSHRETMEQVVAEYGDIARTSGPVQLPVELIDRLPIIRFLQHSPLEIYTAVLVYLQQEDTGDPRIIPYDLWVSGVTR
jgi:hypothetical protein